MVVRRHAFAWLALTAALALHVVDEAAHDFLGFYNPFVMMLRDVTLMTWLPTFEFANWLGGLIVALAVLTLLGRYGFAGARWVAWLSLPYGVLMTGNGLAHIAGSLYFQRWLPGVLSSPLLVAGGLWLLKCTVARLRESRPSLPPQPAPR